MKPVFFATPVEFRAWLAEHHDKSQELWAAFYKRSSGRPSITWPEAVDAALCFGWIDGVRKSIDSVSYTTRFTPRRSDSTWSAVNVKRIRELRKKGLLTSAGLEAFQQRKKSGTYSYEQRHTIKLDSFYEKKLRANRKAWASFQSQAPWYRRTATFWVMSAKKEGTRLKRLATLINEHARGRTIPPLTRKNAR